jgi:hypothetical protein
MTVKVGLRPSIAPEDHGEKSGDGGDQGGKLSEGVWV